MMRHPVDRAYAFYVEQIRTFQSFGRRVNFEQTFEQYMQQVYKFLNLPEPQADDKADLVANRSRDHNEVYIRDKVVVPLRNLPFVGPLGARLSKSWRDRICRVLTTTDRAKRLRQELICPPMRPETRNQLLKELREPTHRLAHYLNRDLTPWMK